jgi:hypothetical protein
MAKKQGKNEFWRKLRHKSGCCCFGWAVYVPWAFYMGIWALYNPKLPKWPLIGVCLISRVIGQLKVKKRREGEGGNAAYYARIAHSRCLQSEVEVRVTQLPAGEFRRRAAQQRACATARVQVLVWCA